MPLGAVATTMMVSSASPREVPTFDAAAYCEAEARRDNALNEGAKTAFVGLCERSVEPHFAEVVAYKWGYVPDQIQRACISSARGSYERLNRCLDNALDVYPSSSLPQIWILERAARTMAKYWTIDECMSRRKQAGGVCRLGSP